MKSWADHCSSDEESDDEHHPARVTAPSASLDQDLSYDESVDHISITGEEDDEEIGRMGGGRGGGGRRNNQPEKIPYPEPINFDDVPPDMPTQKPYTAHIQNLAFNIEHPEDLATKIEGMTKWRYQHKMEVKVTTARLGRDKKTGKRKGFAYVEFDTPEELMIFLNLNDGYSSLNGRILKIAIANNSRGGGNHRRNDFGNNYRNLPDIDGSQFRGGRFARNSNQNPGPSTSTGGGDAHPPAARPTLKLAPRSKPVDGAGKSSGSASIFGSARPRDEGKWRKKNEDPAKGTAPAEGNNLNKSSLAAAAASSSTTSLDDGKVNGRGGRGRGGDKRQNASRGAGRGGRGTSNNRRGDRNPRNNSDRRPKKDADGWDEPKGGKPVQVVPTPAPPVEKKEETKVVKKAANAFAALGFDSDSD
mmetsp:Transcript_9097/g.9980  ORF Transcript_9097/g.9980 Transcript_9097/m.9980 type:complete len:417 (-) Transcript_9097:199-1449(-)